MLRTGTGLASKGLGSLRSPSSLLRKLSYYRLLLTRLRLAKDYKCSNPFFTFKQKTGHSFCYALFFMAESKGLGSLRSPSSLLRKLSYYRLFLARLRLAKDYKGSNPVFTFKQKTGHSFCYALFFMAESKGFEPSNRFRRLHDFQSCSFDQLGQLSIDQMTRNIIYDFIQKIKQIFSYYSKFALSAHIHIKRSPMRLPSEPKILIFLQS